MHPKTSNIKDSKLKMSNRNQLPALVASLAITVVIVLGGAWWIRNNVMEGSVAADSSEALEGSLAATVGNDGTAGVSMLPGKVPAAKQRGLDAMAAGDFAAAQVEFTAALAEKRNDPETLIYLNNAKIGNSSAYTIALSVPASKFANTSLEMMRGVAQAQETLNRSVGINGTPLKVLLFDDRGELDRARAIAVDLAANPDVLGVVGHHSSDTTLKAAEVYEAQGLTVISPTSSAVEIADAGDFVFRTVPSDRIAAATLVRHSLNTLGKKQAAVFFDSESAYSLSVKKEFATELLSGGGEIVNEFDVVDSGFSVSSALQSAQANGAAVIMLAFTLSSIDIPIQVMAMNQEKLPILASDSLYSPRVLEAGRDNAVGLTVAVPWHTLSHTQTPFVNTASSLWGGDVNWRTAMAYDATMALVAGIEADATREGVATALAAPNFTVDGATGPVRFFATGDRNQPSQLVQVVEGNRTRSGYEFVPIAP